MNKEECPNADEVREELDMENVEEEVVTKGEESNSRMRFCIAIVLIFIVIVSTYLIFGKDTIRWVHDRLEHLVQSHGLLPRLILLLCQVPFGTILFLPGLFYFNMMQSILMKRLFETWCISFFGSYLTSLGVFLVTKHCFYTSVQKRFADFGPYLMFKEETKSHPIRDGILLNFIFIPVSVKNYLLGISSLNFWQAMIALVPGPALLCFLSAIVGSEVNNIHDLFTSRPFSKQSGWEKASFIFSILLIILSLGIILGAAIYYRKRYNAFKSRNESKIVPELEKRERHNSGEPML